MLPYFTEETDDSPDVEETFLIPPPSFPADDVTPEDDVTTEDDVTPVEEELLVSSSIKVVAKAPDIVMDTIVIPEMTHRSEEPRSESPSPTPPPLPTSPPPMDDDITPSHNEVPADLKPSPPERKVKPPVAAKPKTKSINRESDSNTPTGVLSWSFLNDTSLPGLVSSDNSVLVEEDYTPPATNQDKDNKCGYDVNSNATGEWKYPWEVAANGKPADKPEEVVKSGGSWTDRRVCAVYCRTSPSRPLLRNRRLGKRSYRRIGTMMILWSGAIARASRKSENFFKVGNIVKTLWLIIIIE